MRWPWPNDSKQLTRIERKVDQIVSSIGDLDELLAQQGAALTSLDLAVQALVAAIPPGNFATEIATVQAALAETAKIAGEVQAATPPPPPPPGG